VFKVTLIDKFQYQSLFVDTENITCRDQRKNTQITDKYHYYYLQVPLRYLLGCLYINFKYLWEPVQKLIATHAQGLNKEDFWRIYLAHLQNYIASGKIQTKIKL
jgi:hypothetical protein